MRSDFARKDGIARELFSTGFTHQAAPGQAVSAPGAVLNRQTLSLRLFAWGLVMVSIGYAKMTFEPPTQVKSAAGR